MAEKSKLKKVITIVKLSVFLTWCWPLSYNASKFMVSCKKLYTNLNIILALGLIAPLAYSAAKHFNDATYLIKLSAPMVGSLQIIWNTVSQKVNCRHIQYVTFEMIRFSDFMKPHEEAIIDRYIDKCLVFYGGFILFFYLSSLMFVIGPIVMDQTFPTIAEYPFNVYHQPLKSIIYIHQSVVGLQVSSQLCTTIYIALLLWFASAKFEILSEEFRTIKDSYHMIECIRKHRKLLEYATEISITARSFTVSSVIFSMMAVIMAFLVYFSQQSLLLRAQFTFIVISGLMEVLLYAWPAEHLINTSKNVANAAFETQWYNQSPKVWKCLQIIILRSQKPITVAVACIMPTMSFSYYATYLSTILSYFTALRVMLINNEN